MPLYSWLLSRSLETTTTRSFSHHLNLLVVHGVPTPDGAFAKVHNLALGHIEFHLPSIGPAADIV